MAGFGGMGRNNYQHNRVPPPKNIGDVPRYLKELLGGFFARFFYIVKLVWSTGWWVLFTLSFVALFRGVSPIIGALISKNILNGLQTVLQSGNLTVDAFWQSDIFYLIVFLFVYRLTVAVINNISSAVNRIAGEKVVRQVKMQIMEKALTLDLGSFDDPNLYEKMENANQEAGSRPLQIITQTFSIISSVIELISYLVILMAIPGLWWVTLIIVAISIPSAVINFVYRRKNFVYMRHRSKERRKMNYYSSVLVDKDRIKEVRLFDLGETFIGRFQESFQEYYQGLRNLILAENAWHVVISLISCCTNLVFYVMIAMRVFTGQILIGDYTLYTGAIASVSTAIS
ncbi:MAG: ABC transporter ATP-binding protein, partial [Oscillospiraceae bacterium]|nr:ABC transporter ATP-binding protein [Oscillospiraceae bacterium]